MSISTIEYELISMTDAERRSVIEIATGMIGQKRIFDLEKKRKQLRVSAELAADYYQCNEELTIWTSLDSAEFIDAQK